MAKRFTATEKWDKAWFRELSPTHKCLWWYLCDRCDNAGVWEPDWQLASFQIGATVNADSLAVFGDRVEILTNGKVALTGFVHFQYGNLSPHSKPHAYIIKTLDKHGLTLAQGLAKGSLTLKDKDKEKDKESCSCSKGGSEGGEPATPPPHVVANDLALAAHAAFGARPNCPSNLVRDNVCDLLQMGRTAAEIAELCVWRKTSKAKFAPQSPAALTAPDKWEQWQALKTKEANGELEEQSAPKSLILKPANPNQYDNVGIKI